MRSVLALCVVALVLGAGVLLLRGNFGSQAEVADGWERESADPDDPSDLRREAPTDGTSFQPTGSDAASAAPAGDRAFAGIRGVVEDERGRALPGATVRLETLDANVFRGATATAGETLATASTAGDGSFELTLETRRWVRVTASLAGRATVGTRVAGPGTFVRLVLPIAATLEVVVVEADEGPVPEATVRAVAREAVLVRETDGGGLARFDDLPPGVVTLEVRAAGGRRARALPLTVQPGTDAGRVVVLLPAGVSVAGLVVDAETLVPVEGAEVHAAQPGLAFAAEPTGPDGAYGPLPAGGAGDRVMLAVRAPGYAPRMLPVLLAAGEPLQRLPPVELHTAADWRGRVVDGQGRPVAGARVTATSAGIAGRTPPETRTDEEGRFTLPPPSPPAPGRRVMLTAEAAAGTAAWAHRPGDPPPVDLVLVLSAGRTVTGRVLRSTGEPAVGAAVRLEPRWSEIADRRRPGPETSRLLALGETARLALTTATDTAGRWRVDGVPDGTYAIRVIHAGATSFADDPLVVAGAAVDAGVLDLGDGHVVEGTVHDASDRPLAGVELALRASSSDPRPRSAYSDSEGRWRLEGVPAGAWQLTARAGLLAVRRLDLEVPTRDPVALVVGHGCRITGHVVDAAGTPYEGVFRVRLEGESRAASHPERAFHDPQGGGFVLDDVWAGTWTVRVTTPQGDLGASPAPVTLRPGTTFDVTVALGPGTALSGILRGPDDRGLPGGRITLTPEERGTARTVTSGSGGAWHAQGLDAGRWRVVARGAGGAAVVETLDLAPGETRELDLVLGPVSTLEVTVRGEDGRARAGAYVLARPESSPAARPGRVPRTDAKGRVTLTDVPLGTVVIEARLRNGESGRVETSIEGGSPQSLEVRVKKSERSRAD